MTRDVKNLPYIIVKKSGAPLQFGDVTAPPQSENCMVKVHKTDRKISPFGGINFVIDEIEQAGIPAMIDGSLPKRHGKAAYSWSDSILGLLYGMFCGADRLEDMANLKNMMHNSKLNIPSPDTISSILRHKLTTSNVVVKSTDGSHKVNINAPLNGLLLDVALKTGQLKAGKAVVLDYDNHIIPCEKEDALFAYTKDRGYQPGVCFVGQTPVYIEGMNGNNPASFDQENTLKRAVALLESKGLTVRRFRADNASYQPEIVKMFDKDGCDFFLRATNSAYLIESMTVGIRNWKTVRLGTDTFEIGAFEYTPFDSTRNEKSYRVVTTRRPTDKPHHITGENFIYRSIITNNRQLSDLDVTWTYNQRGAIEKNFDALNNDWNWSNLPFSYMAQNTTFMLITALGMILYNWLVSMFAKRVDFVEPTFRLKAFRTHVVSVSAEWKGDTLIIFDQTKPWERLAG